MTTSQTTPRSILPKMRSARPGANPRNKLMWSETNRIQAGDRVRRTQTGDLNLEQCHLKECLSRHWVASAVAAWKRTWGHGCGLPQRDLLRQRELCFARGCRALLQAGSAYL
jgi:hypothetical protein